MPIRHSLLALLGIFLTSQMAQAQVTTGTISGVVRDSTGAVVPAVTITLRNLDTGTTRTVPTDEQGRYQALSLSLGNYEVQAGKEGFQSAVRRGIVLTVGREAVVSFDLQVGAVAQSVEVNEEAPLVETTGSSVSGLVDTTQIQDLPLNGRSYDELAGLQPGVFLTRSGNQSFQSGQTQKISIHGARSEQNSFLLDGTDVMGPTNQIPGSVGGQSLGVDTVREFRVETGTFSAQYGRAAGGVINVITKSGTNELHGTLFEFLRNDNLDAAKWEDNRSNRKKPEFKRNQFGFSVGGPLRKDKLFYFGSYEGLREGLGQTLTGTVPTAAARQGQVSNPTTGQIQQVTVNPTVVPYLNLYPLPTGRIFADGTGELVQPYMQPTSETFFTVRMDQNISGSDSLFGRFSFDDGAQTVGNTTNAIVVNGLGNRNQYLTLQETHIFSPRFLTTFRFGFNRSYTNQIPQTPDISDNVLTQLEWVPGTRLFKSGAVLNPGGGMASLGFTNTPRIWALNLFEESADLTYTTGMHTFKGGVLFKRLQFNEHESLAKGGEYSFGGLVSLLTGAPTGVRVLQPGAGLFVGWRYNYLGWYVQDDVRLKSRLTLNLGFRHEFYTKPMEVADRACNLDNLYGEGGTPSAPTGKFRCGGSLFPTSYSGIKNLGPRVGFAWDVAGNGKTSVRGGFGIFFDSMSPLWWQAGADTQPPGSLLFSPGNPAFPNLYNYIVTGAGQVPPKPTPSPIGFTTLPSTMQYTFTFQRQLSGSTVLALGYVGSMGRHLWDRANKNIVEPTILSDGRKFFPANGVLRNPNFGGRVSFAQTEVNSSYNGMIVSLQKRMSHGLQFQTSYTFSKSLDTNAGVSIGTVFNADYAAGLMDPDNWKADRGLSDFDTRHNITFNSTWDVPVGPGKALGSNLKGVGATLLGGWQMTGVVKIASAFPFTISSFTGSINWSRNGCSTICAQRPDLLPGKSNNPILGNPDEWFDPTAFRVAQLGFYGNLGRNTLSAPDLAEVDFSLLKNFDLKRISEQFRLQFRSEFFNIANHPNFSIPQYNIFNAQGQIVGNAGQITSTATSARQIQFGLKLYW